MHATGTTVDADAKSLEAARDASGWHDNIIVSNATPENNVPVAADGLGGFDSRKTGSFAMPSPAPGYRLRAVGYVEIVKRNLGRTEVVVAFEQEA